MAAWRQRWGDRMSFPTPRPLRGLFERKFRLSMYPTYLNKIYTTEFLKAQKLFNIKVFLKVLVHRMSFINPQKLYDIGDCGVWMTTRPNAVYMANYWNCQTCLKTGSVGFWPRRALGYIWGAGTRQWPLPGLSKSLRGVPLLIASMTKAFRNNRSF